MAGSAAVAQVVVSAMEAHARNNAPVGHSSTGLRATPDCDNEGQYPCVSVSGVPSPADPPRAADPEMNSEEARSYVLDYINAVRRNPWRRRAGSRSLGRRGGAGRERSGSSGPPDRPARDRPARPGRRDPRRARDVPRGAAPAPAAGPARVHPAAVDRREAGGAAPRDAHARRLAEDRCRIVTRDGRTHFTVDFAPEGTTEREWARRATRSVPRSRRRCRAQRSICAMSAGA